MINNLGTSSFKLQINFDVLQIDTENSTTGFDNNKTEQRGKGDLGTNGLKCQKYLL